MRKESAEKNEGKTVLLLMLMMPLVIVIWMLYAVQREQ